MGDTKRKGEGEFTGGQGENDDYQMGKVKGESG